MTNLLNDSWKTMDSYELRLLLDKHVGGPGQYDGIDENPNKIYLPLAREACQIGLTYNSNGNITAMESGPAFDATKWQRSSQEIEQSILGGPLKVGRDYSFSGYRVSGSWRGERSGVQILPPPDDAPRAPVEEAHHPFILEFPIKASDFWSLTNYRRIKEHRNLTLLLNLLLAGGTSLQPVQSEHFWACVSGDDESTGNYQRALSRGFLSGVIKRWFGAWSGKNLRARDAQSPEIKWVQQFYFAKLGEVVIDQLSPPAGEKLEELEPEEYFANVGYDGKGLRVPADLDNSICLYLSLNEENRAKFDRAVFWMDMASRQWANAASSSFASLVTASESLTERGSRHRAHCDTCNADFQHEVPGATERFRAFFEKYAPGESLRNRRSQMYNLRSGILHGSKLMELDQYRRFGWDPPGWNQTELHRELWGLTRTAARNWLQNPTGD
jgi:Apea-like HEPN